MERNAHLEITLGKNPDFEKYFHLERNPTLKFDRHTWKEFTLGKKSHLEKILTWKKFSLGKRSYIENRSAHLERIHTWRRSALGKNSHLENPHSWKSIPDSGFRTSWKIGIISW